MKYACAPPMSALYQAPKSPAQSDRIPILTALDGVAAALLVPELLLLLLPPHAANQRPHTANTATAISDRLSRCRISLSNLVTSSATFVVVRSGHFVVCTDGTLSRSDHGLDAPPVVETPACSGTASSSSAVSGAARCGSPSARASSRRSLGPIPI